VERRHLGLQVCVSTPSFHPDTGSVIDYVDSAGTVERPKSVSSGDARGMKVHRSVKTRMLARATEGEGKPYHPKIRCVINGEARRLTREEWLAENQSTLSGWTD
jgi:hypothetical protein